MPSLIMSVHPEYADRILEGKKTIELRNVDIKALQNRQGRTVYLYATSPIKKIVGRCTMLNECWDDNKKELSIKDNFERIFRDACISKEEYFSKYPLSWKYSIYEPYEFKEPVDIKDFSIGVSYFKVDYNYPDLLEILYPVIKRAPQSYQYIKFEEKCRTCEHCRRGWCMLNDTPIIPDGCSDWNDDPLVVSEYKWKAGGL